MATRQPAHQAARRRSRLASANQHKPLYRRTLRYEPLEDRRLLALVTVNTPLDIVDLDDGLTSLREAIFATNLVGGPDTIDFAAALTASGPATISLTQGELRITDDVTIEGPGADLLTIDASGNDPTPDVDDRRGSRVFNIDDGSPATLVNVSISGLTLTGADGSDDAGGAIRAADAALVIENNTISNNHSNTGAGAYLIRSSATFVRSTISNNTNTSFSSGSAIFGFQMELAVIESEVKENQGAGIFSTNAGDTQVIDSTITNNDLGIFISHSGRTTTITGTLVSGNDVRGGIYVKSDNGGHTTITDCTVVDNDSINFSLARNSAGGIAVVASEGSLTTIANSTVSGNTGPLAGGIVIRYGTASIRQSLVFDNQSPPRLSTNGVGGILMAGVEIGEISDSTVSNNVTQYRGGGIVAVSGNTGNIQISRCTITSNSAREAGGLAASGQVTVQECLISENVAEFRAGGIWLLDNRAQVIRSTIANNSAGTVGGGIDAAGGSVVDSTINGNSAGESGGGIFAFSTAVSGSTISGNSAVEGGGIWLQATTVNQSTISGNTAVNGAGIYSSFNSQVDHSMIAFNEADSFGGGVFVWNGTFTLNQSIVARNSASGGSDITGLFGSNISSRYSVIGRNAGSGLAPAPVGMPDANGNLIGGPASSGGPIDPRLGPLADNGGPTRTHALLPSSPAINAGDLNLRAGEGGVPQFDQRGEPFGRVVNGRIDIGAFEFQEPSDLNLIVDTLADESDGNHGRGDLSLREAIELTNLYPSNDTIRFDLTLTAAGPATILLTQGELKITDDLVINGPSAELLTIDASGNDPTPLLDNGEGSRVFTIDDNAFGIQLEVAITDVRIIGGDVSGSGGGILSVENLMLSEVTLSDNAASSNGGGLYAFGNSGRVMITDVSVVNNRAFEGGGMVLYVNGTSEMLLTRAMVENNTAQRRAGGILALAGGSAGAAAISIASTSVSHNFAGTHSGGGYFEANFNGNISASDCDFSDNEALGSGGGLLVFVANFMGTATINRCNFSNNVSNGNGGGLVLSNHGHGTITAGDITVSGNSAANRGGGIAVSHNNSSRTTTITTRLEGLTVTDNTSQGEGGGISFFGSNGGGKFSLSRSIITGNSAALDGGGIHLYNSHTSRLAAASADEILLADNFIAYNFADRDGGGVFASTRVSVQGSRGSLTIDRNTIYLNFANDGGGIYLHSDTAVAQVGRVSQIIADSTISSNQATGLGGGLFIGQQSLSSVDVNRSTVAQNRGDLAAGGVFVTNGTLSMKHALVARNGSPTGLDFAVILGAMLSPRFSLIGSNDHSGLAESPAGSADANGNLIGGSTNGFIDPRLGPLLTNGGDLPTHALRPGSPAINAGDPAAVAGVGDVPQFDQRGAPFTRVYGGRIDIGAFESQPNPLTGDYNYSGVVDAADYVLWRKTRGATFDLRADGNGDGVVNQDDWQVWRGNFGEHGAEGMGQGVRSGEPPASGFPAGSGEPRAGSGEQEAAEAPQRVAWRPPVNDSPWRTSPSVFAATFRPAVRPPSQTFAPGEDLLAAIATPLRGINLARDEFIPARRQSLRDADAELDDASFDAVDQVFETLGQE